MYLIKQIEIKGLWGSRDLSFDLAADVNFLVGKNGSGKTAVMRIIAHTLAGNGEALRGEPFQEISINLLSETRDLEILKAHRKISDSDGQPSVKFTYRNVVQEPQILRYLLSNQRESSPLREALSEDLKVTWLNIDRDSSSNSTDMATSARKIDATLNNVRRRMTSHFARLKSLADAEIESFIRFVFANMIPDIETPSKARDIEISEESVLEIYRTFRIDEEDSKRKLHKYFQKINSLKEVFIQGKPTSKPTTEDVMAISSLLPLASVLATWHSTSERKREILQWQDKFVEIINRYFSPKRLEISPTNEPEFHLDDGRVLPPTELSSGEKQIFIILGEALLQEQTRSIYLADEPELSLHVEWQEQLVDAIRGLNRSAQILFATHSPDIIGKHRENVFDMAKTKQ